MSRTMPDLFGPVRDPDPPAAEPAPPEPLAPAAAASARARAPRRRTPRAGSVPPVAEARVVEVEETLAELLERPHTQVVGVRLPVDLLDSLKTALDAARLAGDYRFGTSSQVMREVLALHYAGQLHPERRPLRGRKQNRTLNLNRALLEKFHTAARSYRSELLERLLRTYLAQGLRVLPRTAQPAR